MKVSGLYRDESRNEPAYQQYEQQQQQQQLQQQQEQTSSQATAQLSTKKAWRLKKSTKTEDEIKQERQKYEDLEFSPKKASSRRPRNRPGQTNQEFVFVDLSPRKKESKVDTEPVNKPAKKHGRVSRLFKLSSGQDNVKESLKLKLMTDLSSPGPSYLPNKPPSPTTTVSQSAFPRPPPLKRSYTTLAQRHSNRERSDSSTSLVMTISDSGRAVLQPSTTHPPSSNSQQQPLSTSSSTSDLFSLSRIASNRCMHYSRSPIPSPKRIESPTAQERFQLSFDIPKYSLDQTSSEDEDENEPDAMKAFSRAVKRNGHGSGRKRANTNSSQTSAQSNLVVSPIIQRTLTRNHSISSISSSIYKNQRFSSSRANLLRQAANPSASSTPITPDFIFGDGTSSSASYFDDAVKVEKPGAFQHKKQQSISVLGLPLQIGADTDDIHTDESESPFDFGTTEFISDMNDLTSTAPSTADYCLGEGSQKFDNDDVFDLNAFINYETNDF